jgi:hypothetical protein
VAGIRPGISRPLSLLPCAYLPSAACLVSLLVNPSLVFLLWLCVVCLMSCAYLMLWLFCVVCGCAGAVPFASLLCHCCLWPFSGKNPRILIFSLLVEMFARWIAFLLGVV